MKKDKLKILHIITVASGGAFTGTYRLHTSLLNHGVDSQILVRDLPIKSKFKNVTAIDQSESKSGIVSRLLFKFGIASSSIQKRMSFLKGKKGNYEALSFPFSDFDITKNQAYQDCDIVHLHWVANFLDYESFFKLCKKPVVITLRDLFPLQGVFHYSADVAANKDEFGLLEEKMKLLKTEAIKNFKYPIEVVGISKWITELSQNSDVHGHLTHQTIHNCINVNNYCLFDKNALREEFNISKDYFVISFVSDGVSFNRKGIDMVVEAVNGLDIAEPIVVLTVGGGIPPVFPFKINHRHLGRRSQEDLNKIYGVSDAFIFPSREEAFGNVMIEAMACGVPVIGTPVGGLLDVIKSGFNGVFAEEVSSDGLKNAIKNFMKMKENFNSTQIRKYIQENFSESVAAEKYLEVYHSLIEKN